MTPKMRLVAFFFLGVIGLAVLIVSGAKATGLTGYACQGWGMTVLAGPSVCGAAPSPPAGCDGTIDLSNGCVQPMLR